MIGKEQLAVDLSKARLNAAMNSAAVEMQYGQTSDEREGVTEEAPQQPCIERRRRFTIRSGSGKN